MTGSTATVNWSLTGPGSLSSATGPSANISIAPTVLSGGVLFYKADGSGELSTFSGNTCTKVKTYAAGELPANAALVVAAGN